MVTMKNPVDLFLTWLGTVGLSGEDADHLTKNRSPKLDGARSRRGAATGSEASAAAGYEIKTLGDGAVVAVIENRHGAKTTESVPSYSGGDREVLATHRVYNQTSLRTCIEGLRKTGMNVAPEEKILAALEAATAAASQTEAMKKIRITGFVAEGTLRTSRAEADPATGEIVYSPDTHYEAAPSANPYSAPAGQKPFIRLFRM